MTRYLVTGAGGMLGTDLREALVGRDAMFLTRAELDITDPDADEDDEEEGELLGIYLAVTAPADVPLRVISAKLAALTKDMQLCWTELARAAGESTERHEAMEERYGL